MDGSSKYYGVILAAGTGSRIKPLNISFPKPLLPICNKPIIQYQIESMIDLGIRKVFIVCGYLKEEIEKYFNNVKDLDITIHYIEQKKPLGIAHALSKVEPYIDKPFLLFLGDIFYITKDLQKILQVYENRQACGILAVKMEMCTEYIKKNYAVFLHESGMVKRVVEKPRYVSNCLKGCGIYLFDLPIFDAVRRTPRTAMRDEYEITSSIQILIDDGYPIYHADIIDWDMNVTTVDDLLFCNLKMLKLLNKDNEIGQSVSIHKKAKIAHSVIGHNVIIKNPIVIDNSLVMSETKVSSKDDLSNVVLINDLIIQTKKSFL